MNIRIKRVYEPYTGTDGYRILIDRLWPRGISKENGHIDKWLKEVAPSTDLRKWFNHEPEKWPQFCAKYKAEVKGSTALDELLTDIHDHKTVTLLYGARDERHNQAIALERIIRERLA
jgi:uncharacterized protein YeaO (DUF488 family)